MEKQVLIVCLIVGFLGVLSVILGFTAEVTKINLSDLYIGDYACYYPSSPAFGCGIMAAILLIGAQIVVTAFSGCCGCRKRDPTAPALTGNKRTIFIILVVFSWITFTISVALFIVGADKNGTGNVTVYTDICYVVKPGVFATGAIFSLITLSLSITAFILFRPSNDSKQNNANIAMGVPQFPPQVPGNGAAQYMAPSTGGGAQYMPPGNGGAQYQTQGNAGAQYMPPGNGGAQYQTQGNAGAQYPPPRSGGAQYTPPGNGGAQYPPPGTGGVQYTSSTDMTHYPPPASGSKN